MSVLDQTNQDLKKIESVLDNKEKLNKIKVDSVINTPSCSKFAGNYQKIYFDKVIEKISIQNYSLIKTEDLQSDIYTQLNKFVKDSKFVISEVEKIDNVISELDRVGGFSENYLKDFYKGSSDNYFDFIESYIEVSDENKMSILNNNFSILENRRRLLPEFSKDIVSKNYLIDSVKLFQESFDYTSTASFVTQNLINLYRSYNYFYPNCISIKSNAQNFVSFSFDLITNYRLIDILKIRNDYSQTFNEISIYKQSGEANRLKILNFHNKLDKSFYLSDFFANKNKKFFYVKVDGLDDQITNKDFSILNSVDFNSVNIGNDNSINLENYVETSTITGNKSTNHDVQKIAMQNDNISYYAFEDFYPLYYEYKPSYRIYANNRGFSTNNVEEPESLLSENRYFFNDTDYNKNSIFTKKDSDRNFVIKDSLYDNIEDEFIKKYYFKNSASIFNKVSSFFSLIDNKSYKYYDYTYGYDIKNRYDFYKEKYLELFGEMSNEEINHIPIKSSSRGAYLLPKPLTNNSGEILLINKKEDTFINKKTYQYKVAVNKCVNRYFDLKLKNNKFYNSVKENFENIKKFYDEKEDNNTVDFVYNKDKGITRKNVSNFVTSTIDDKVYLNSDNNSKIDGLNNSIKKIAKNISETSISIEDINDFKKKTLSNNIFKNNVSLNKRVFKDVNNVFLNFKEEFIKDYQTSAFDKLLTSLFSNEETLNKNENKEVVKLLVACAILKKNNVELNYMNGSNNKQDVDELEKYLEFKKLSKHIFSSKNINYQEKYILESNVLGHFLDKTQLNSSVLNNYKEFYFGTETNESTIWNELNYSDNVLRFQLTNSDFFNTGERTLNISKRICNSIALCFPYNTINNFGTAKTLDHKRNIPVYYEYGNSIGSSFRKTKNALSGDAINKIITFSAHETSSVITNSLNLPKPIVHRKINTIDSYKNSMSSIEHSKQYEDECFTIAMHYLWDKKFDYKDIDLLDGTKINTLDDFISNFSKKDTLPNFSNTWENLKDTSSYPLHEMFYVNRVLKNKLFDNIKNSNSILNKIIEFIIDAMNSIHNYNTKNINTLPASLKFLEDNSEILELAFNGIYCYSLIYEEYYNKFIELYFSCIQEIPFIKDSIYDLGTYDEFSNDDKSAMFYYSFCSDYLKYVSKLSDNYIELAPGGKHYYANVENLSRTQLLRAYKKYDFDIDNEKVNFYSSFLESLFDNTISINYEHDEKYMFQENASLYFNEFNRVSMNSGNKAKPYVDANNYLLKCLNIVSKCINEHIIVGIDDLNVINEVNNESYSKNTTLSIFKDIHESLRKADINIAFSFDTLINYVVHLSKFNKTILDYKNRILKSENILNDTKNEFDDSEDSVLENMLNYVYRNKLKQNLSYLNDYVSHTESSIYLKDKAVNEVIESFDITYFEKIKYNNLKKYVERFSSINSDIIILKFDNELLNNISDSSIIKFVITKTFFNSDEEEKYEYYYSPIMTHFEFLKEKEIPGNVGYIDRNEKNIKNAYKIATKEEFLENYKTILGIEDEEIANKIFNTYQYSNFSKAALHLCLGTNVKENLHNSDDFISIDTLGLIENIDEFTLNKVFNIKSFPLGEIQNFNGEVYNNIPAEFDKINESFTRKHLNFISKFNSNIQIQQMLSSKNIDDYIIFTLFRPFYNSKDRIVNYTIQAEEIF